MNLNEQKIPDLSGKNLAYNLSTNLITKKVSFSFFNRETDKILEKNYLEIKSKYENKEFSLYDLDFDDNLNHFVNHLLFDLTKQLSLSEIESDVFISNSFKIISECLQHGNFQIYYNEFIDFYRLNNRFDLVLQLIQSGKISIDFSLIHDLEYNLKKRILSGELLLSILKINSSLNGIVRDKLTQFSDYMDNALSNLYSNKYSFYTALFGIEKSVHEINKEFTMKFVAIENGRSLKFYQTKRRKSFEYYHKNKGKEMFKKYDDLLLSFRKNEASQKWIINSWKGDGNGPVWYGISNPLSYENGPNSFFNYIENTFTNIFKLLVSNSQDDFRVSIGLPKIGQGWVSETNLYNAVSLFFEAEIVVQHASPKWLGRQHLDIYFPNLNIGIEYQGKQHNEPISFFGGEEAFHRTIERDERKKQLCLENGCLLFYVYPETNTDEFLLELENKIMKRKNS
jgi:hypothetical protein